MILPLDGHTWNFKPRFDLERDAPSVLDGLRDAGAAGFEGFLDHVPCYVAPASQRGLRIAACHAPTAALRDLPRVLSLLREAECRDLCVSGTLEWRAREPHDYREAAPLLNDAGHRLRDAGVHLHYHNHDFEFVPFVDGTRGIDILGDELEAEAITFCADVGWMHLAGTDPVTWLKEHASRIGFVHVRDFAGTQSCELGRGEMDLRAVAQLLPALTGVRGLAVEQDAPPDPIASLRQSLDFWRGLNKS